MPRFRRSTPLSLRSEPRCVRSVPRFRRSTPLSLRSEPRCERSVPRFRQKHPPLPAQRTSLRTKRASLPAEAPPSPCAANLAAHRENLAFKVRAPLSLRSEPRCAPREPRFRAKGTLYQRSGPRCAPREPRFRGKGTLSRRSGPRCAPREPRFQGKGTLSRRSGPRCADQGDAGRSSRPSLSSRGGVKLATAIASARWRHGPAHLPAPALSLQAADSSARTASADLPRRREQET